MTNSPAYAQPTSAGMKDPRHRDDGLFEDLNWFCAECGHRNGLHSSETDKCNERIVSSQCPCPGFTLFNPDPTGSPDTVEQYTIERTENMTDVKANLGEYPLPNGKVYLSRHFLGFENDVEGLRWLVKRGINVFLVGEPGCGKTALMQAAFPDAENEIGSSDKKSFDMLWAPRPDPKDPRNIIWDPKPLVRAVMKGVPVYVDEAMRLNGDAWTPYFSAMDGRGYIVGGNLDGTDLPVAPGFAVVGASNPDVRGAFMPEAITSRFHILTVETSEDLLKRLKIDDRLITLWNNLNIQEEGQAWKPSVRELLAAQSFIDAGNEEQAVFAITGWRVPARERAQLALTVGPTFGVRVGQNGGVIK